MNLRLVNLTMVGINISKSGQLTSGTIENSYVSGLFPFTDIGGGIAGYMAGGTIKNSYASVVLNAETVGGGIVSVQFGGSIENCYATGLINSTQAAGIVGEAQAGTISNSYSAAAVSGGINGGIAGYVTSSSVSISDSYATGPAGVGGLVGLNSFQNVSNSYWDIDTTGLSNSAGGGTGKHDPAMQLQSTYSVRDFTGTWQMSTYPILRGMPACSDGTSGTCYFCGDGTNSINCTPCSSDASCTSGYSCVSNGIGGGLCYPGGDPVNGSCTSDTQCAISNFCENNGSGGGVCTSG